MQTGTMATSLFPALSGWHGGFQAAFTGQYQWIGFEGRPEQFSVSGDGYIHPIRSRLTASFSSEGLGRTRFDVIAAHWAGRIKLGAKSWIMPTAGYSRNRYQVQSNWRSLTDYYLDPIVEDQGYTSIANQFHTGLGLVSGKWYSSLQYSGRVTFDDDTPTHPSGWQTSYSLPHTLSGMVSSNFFIKDFVVSPTLIASSDFTSLQLKVAANLNYKGVFIGLGSDVFQNLVFAAGFELFESIRLGYAYSHYRSRLRFGSSANHEIGLRIILPSHSSNRTISTIGLL
ncbi:MAG: hypothetical protein Salg2KO_10500 [Salibacteraceae bacterium]